MGVKNTAGGRRLSTSRFLAATASQEIPFAATNG